jgi:hypothetical protein
MNKSTIVLCFLAPLLFSCGDNASSTDDAMASLADSTIMVKQKISNEAIKNIIQSIPSPIEISLLLKESGSVYNKTILNPHENYKNYNNQFKKAINLGIYSTDLGYVNIYSQNGDALDYLTAVKRLADDLNIGQFFDLETIKNMAMSSNNMEELLYMTMSNFEKINNYLQDKNRTEQSILILTGGWLEAVHISCLMAEQKQNVELNEKIGEQKIILEKLVLLLNYYKQNQELALLLEDLNKLQEVYNDIDISYVYKESTMKEVDGMLVIVDESSSQVSITQEQLESIGALVRDIRKKIIS